MYIPRKFIPSLFTILNAFCGFLSLLNAANGDIHHACLFIIYAALFDGVDGIAARLTNSSSRFGVELDSLADVISFGLAPSVILYYSFYNQYNDIGLVLSSLIMIFAAIRLARFNVQLDGFEKNEFRGLPAPMAAFTIVSYMLFYHDKNFSPELSRIFIIALSVILPMLMVSKFRYHTLPNPSKRALLKDPIKFIVLFIAVALIIFTKGEGSFAFCLFYISSGIFIWIKNGLIKKRKNPEARTSKFAEIKEN